MKARPDCIVCMFRQALNTARLVTSDETLQLEILRRVARTVAEPDMNQTPAALSKPAYAIIANVTGVRDPYRLSKHETNRVAMGLLPALRERIASSPDPLDTALHVAAAGNVIDLGIGHEFDIEQDVYALIDTPFAINALDAFRSELRRCAAPVSRGQRRRDCVRPSTCGAIAGHGRRPHLQRQVRPDHQ